MSAIGITRKLIFGAAVSVPIIALAQPPGPPDDDNPPPPRGRQDRAGEGRPRPPVPPIMVALDTNHDGELSTDEIRNASAALKSLDHNHDGLLDRSELDPRDGGPGRPDGPPPDGPEGPPDGPPRGGPPPGAGRGRPEIGRVLPPFVRDELELTDRQLKQIADLENVVKGKLESILSAKQIRTLRDHLNRGPGGRGGRGPGAPPADDNEPPVRPRRPQ